MKSGKLYSGTIHFNRNNIFEACIITKELGEILIHVSNINFLIIYAHLPDHSHARTYAYTFR